MKRKLLTAGCTALLFASTVSFAEEFEVQMLNQGTDVLMVFEPSVLQIQVGDTVTFSPANPGHKEVQVQAMCLFYVFLQR